MPTTVRIDCVELVLNFLAGKLFDSHINDGLKLQSSEIRYIHCCECVEDEKVMLVFRYFHEISQTVIFLVPEEVNFHFIRINVNLNEISDLVFESICAIVAQRICPNDLVNHCKRIRNSGWFDANIGILVSETVTNQQLVTLGSVDDDPMKRRLGVKDQGISC